MKSDPLTPPKVERATEMGMIQAITPSSFSPNVCGERQKDRAHGEAKNWEEAGED